MISSHKKSSTFITDQTQLSLPLGAHSLLIQVVKYDLNQYEDSLYSTFKIEQPSESKQWIIKRKAQFLAGRIASKYALKTMDAKDETIHIGKHREPLWDENIIGSISHDNGVSIATAQFQKSSNQGIGLDIQTILNDQEITETTNIVLTANDKKLLKKTEQNSFYKQFSEQSYNQLFTLLFSAKESFFKAAFKEIGQHFNFDVMSLKSVDFESKTLLLKCEKTVSDNIVCGSEYLLYFNYLIINEPVFITYFVFSPLSKRGGLGGFKKLAECRCLKITRSP